MNGFSKCGVDMFLWQAVRKETTKFGQDDSVVPQRTKILNGHFCCIFFDNFFTSPSFSWILTNNFLYKKKSSPTKLETSTWNPQAKSQNCERKADAEKTKQVFSGSSFTDA